MSPLLEVPASLPRVDLVSCGFIFVVVFVLFVVSGVLIGFMFSFLPSVYLVSAPRAFVVVLVVAELLVCLFSSLETGSGKSEHETLTAFGTRNGPCHLYLVFGHDPTLHAIVLVQGLDIIRYD